MSGQPEKQNQRTNRKQTHKHEQEQNQIKREQDENPNGNQAATKTKRASIHHLEPSRSPNADQDLKENRSTHGGTEAGHRWRSGARPGETGAVVLAYGPERESVRVTVGDALPAGKQPPKHEQNGEDP
jgi:hypothetical protein